MNVESFLAYHSIVENPFGAEEARHDAVFEKLIQQANQNHPDFAKILGRIDRPTTAVIFGEKGSGKTAIRLMIGQKVAGHNHAHPDNRTLLIGYDDLNPTLNRIAARQSRREKRRIRNARKGERHPLDMVRIEDHQDAILSLGVTKLVDALLNRSDELNEPMLIPEDMNRRVKTLSRRQRGDLAVLAALYDQPASGSVSERWRRLHKKMKLGWRTSISLVRAAAVILTLFAAGLWFTPSMVSLYTKEPAPHAAEWILPAAAILGGAAAILWLWWLARHLRLWRLCRRLYREMPAVKRTPGQLRHLLMNLRPADLVDQPWPIPSGDGANSRYLITAKFLELLAIFDYTGVMVVVDRVDEPTLVSGHPDVMKSIIWPMLDNKFLQQDAVGLKLLLPIELRHMLRRESAEFFQEARLDKQNLIEHLMWSGPMLYDLCSARLRACQAPDSHPVYLTDLFDPEVSRESLVDALEQMHQPRDAFKFLYSVIQEHCRAMPDDKARFTIPRQILENVRRDQSQRVQEFYRGLTPA